MNISETESGAKTSFDVSDSFGREGLERNQTSRESGPIDATRAISMTRYHIGEEIIGRLPVKAQCPCRCVGFRLGDCRVGKLSVAGHAFSRFHIRTDRKSVV